MTKISLEDLTRQLTAFRDARDWKQFHGLKNLIVSLNLESAELLELTQWLSDTDVEEKLQDDAFRARLSDEVADVFLYLLLICARADIDVVAAAEAKIARNEERYPVEKSKGNAKKYTAL